MRYLRLFAVQLRASIQVTMQYRAEFFVGAFMVAFWLFWNLMPLLVLWGQRPKIAGWTLPGALLVTAWFTLLRSLLDGAVQPSLVAVVEHIRKGTLDFILLKPADAQFLVSTSRFELFRFINVAGGLALLAFALRALRRTPPPAAIVWTILLLAGAIVILYAIWIVVVCLAFVVVKVDNLSYLFASIYDAARWPASVFRGVVAFVFTFIIPLTVMTTFPAEAILERLSPASACAALAGSLASFVLARLLWTRAIARYTSAGG